MQLLAAILLAVPLATAVPQFGGGGSAAPPVNSTTCNGRQYIYQELAGYGFIEDNARDNFGDTIGGIGSSIAVDRLSWVRLGNSYSGLMYSIPDRGWNTEQVNPVEGMSC